MERGWKLKQLAHVSMIGYNVYGSGASNKSYGVYIGSPIGRYDTSGGLHDLIGYNCRL